MKKLFVIGYGMNFNTLTKEGYKILSQNNVKIFSSNRLKQNWINNTKQEKNIFVSYKITEIKQIIEDYNDQDICLIVSGDTSFFSAAKSYKENFEQNREMIYIPGISSLSYLASKLKIDINDITFGSIHGRKIEYGLNLIFRNKKTFFLVDSSSLEQLSLLSNKYGIGKIKVTIGMNLGTEEEKIFETELNKIDIKEKALVSIIVDNPKSVNYARTGIEDSFFIRGKVPMTKQHVRSLICSILCPKSTDIIWDIGCGTGSVSVELGLLAYEGWIYSIDKNEEAVELTEKNLVHAGIANSTVINGNAPKDLSSFPIPDIVFIGGSSGNIYDIIENIMDKNTYAKILITSITIDTLSEVLKIEKKLNIKWQINQINFASVELLGNHHLLKAQNPIFIISKQKQEKCNEET